MIRFILCAFVLILLTFCTVFAYPFYKLLRRRDKHKGDLFAFRFVQFWLHFVAIAAGCKVTYKGLEYLPEDGEGVVFIANHRSFFDILLTMPKFKGLTGALAKQEIGKWPIVGIWLKAIYGILLNRKDVREGMKSIVEGIGYVKSGISILAFPEGTRNHVEGELLMFHKGTFKLATKPKAKIIPIAINNTGNIFDDHRPFVKSQHSIVEFCEPIDTSKLTKEEEDVLHDTVRNIILEKITKNAAEL